MRERRREERKEEWKEVEKERGKDGGRAVCCFYHLSGAPMGKADCPVMCVCISVHMFMAVIA